MLDEVPLCFSISQAEKAYYRSISDKVWALKNSQKISDYRKLYYAKNKLRLRKYQNELRSNNREKYRLLSKQSDRRMMEKRFGVSYPTWWLCDLCNRPISVFDIRLDHDHTTGQFRGWLCNKCNYNLGWVEGVRLVTISSYL